MSHFTNASRMIAAGAAGILLAACAGGGGMGPNVGPDFIVGAVSTQSYNGNTDDLATGGLGKSGLVGIYNNYRALVDVDSPKGGYGTLFGPNVDVNGIATSNEGKVAGPARRCLPAPG